MSNSKVYSNNFPFNTGSSKRNNTSKTLTINNNKDNNINIKSSEELKNIFNSISSESSQSIELKFTTNDLLSIYIKRNRSQLNEILIEISQFFNNVKINPELLIQCLDSVYNSLMENNQIINFLNLMVPILVKSLYQIKNQNISSINKLCLFIGKLLKQGGIYIRELIENNINVLLDQFNEEEELYYINERENKSISVSIQLLCQIFKNSPLLAFNKIVGKNGFDRFLKVINCFKNNKREIRYMTGELIIHFIKMFTGRDKETKLFYLKLIYEYILKEYNKNLENSNDVPNDYNIVSGYIIVVENINLAEPSFFRDTSVYLELINNLFKCTDSNNINIKKEFIKFLPELYYINKSEFKSKYEIQIMEYINTLLNVKTNNEIRNQLLLTIGKFSYFIKDDGYKIIINQFFSLIIYLISDKNILDDEVLKCLSDLLNNKINIYINQIKSIDVLAILPRLFKTFLSTSKVDYLVSIMKFYNYDSIENISTAIISLNAISYILFEDSFTLDYFKRTIGNKKKAISQRLDNILMNMRVDICAYESKQNNNDIKSKKSILGDNLKLNNNNNQLIINSLTLFSLIPNTLFFKDMFIFLNEKLIPLLSFVSNKIYKKIIDLVLCDFVKIYQDDINLSEYIFYNITESIMSTPLDEKNLKTQLYCYKILIKKEKFGEILSQNKNSFIIKTLGEISSINENNIQEKYIEGMSKIALKDTDKSYYFVYVKKNIYSIIFKFYYLKDIIEKENLSFTLYYITTHLINFFYPSLVVTILDIANYLTLIEDLKGIMMINIYKSVIEILKSDLIKEVKDNVIFKESCDLMLILCFDIIKMESIDESKYDIILELIYLIIKNNNIDIFNIEEIINRIKSSSFMLLTEKLENNKTNELLTDINKANKLKIILDKQNNKNTIEILYRNILNVENENCVLNVLKIFGLCGAIDQNKIKNFFGENNNLKYLYEFDNNYKSIEERGIQIISYNNKLKYYEEIDTSFTDPFNIKAVLYCMELLKMNKQQELSIKIISTLNTLIKSIPEKESNLIDIILPTLIQIIPKFQIEQQKSLFDCIRIILNNFEDKSKKYLDDVIPFVINYFEKRYLDVLSKLISILFEKYTNEFENYYSILVPKYISIIRAEDGDYFTYDKLFILFIKYNEITSYLKILAEELKLKLFEERKPKFIYGLLCLFEQICDNKNSFILYSSIISVILSKLQFMLNIFPFDPENNIIQKNNLELFLKSGENNEINLSIIYKILDIFKKINDNARDQFSSYLTLILNIFSYTGLIKYTFFKKKLKNFVINNYDYTFMTCEKYLKKIIQDDCKINCKYGFNSLTINKPIKSTLAKTMIENDNSLKYKNIDNKLVLSVFDNNHCTLEEDWDEWLKSCIKLLLQQSPSIYLYNCREMTDYYLSIASELSTYAFYTLYMNSNDKIKIKLTKNLTNVLKNPKVNDNLLLLFFDYFENMERRNINMFLIDYHLFGEITYKIKAYAKSLFYLEKEFLITNDAITFEKLILLYYQLGLPENALGLIKLAEDHEYEDLDNYENKFIWYINLKDYRKALDMIEEKLQNEYDINKINTLNKYRNICLDGLFNWEEILLLEDDCINNNNEKNENKEENINLEDKPADKYYEFKEFVEKEIFLSNIHMNLDKWDNLKNHILRINKKIKENFDIGDIEYDNKNDFNNSDIIFIKNNENKNESFQQLNERINPGDYISYNNLTFKNIYLSNKVDESIIFNLNLISSIVNIMEGKYEIATKYKNDAKEIVLYKIKSLLKESHSRGYSFLINNQELSYLEDIINYKQYHDGDLNYLKEMKQRWDKSFSKISFEPGFCRRLLSLYRFIFPEKELFTTKIKMANIYRKFGFYEQSKTLLEKYKNDIDNIIKIEKNEDNLITLNEQKIKIELSYNKCLYEKGEYNEAVKNSKILVNLLRSNNSDNIYHKINNKLKGKIYGDYGLYEKKNFEIYKEEINHELSNNIKKKKEFFVTKKIGSYSPQLVHKKYNINNNKMIQLKSKIISHNSLSKDKGILFSSFKNNSNGIPFNDYFQSKVFKKTFKESKNINHYLKLATKYYKTNYKYWYNFCTFNYFCYKYLHNKRIMSNELTVDDYEKKVKFSLSLEISFANNTINGIKNCLFLAENNLDKSYQNCIRLIDIFFNLGGENKELLCLVSSIFYECNLKIFAQLIPLFISRLGNKNVVILENLIKALVEICLKFPFESLIPLIINKYSSSNKRKSITNQILYLVEKRNPAFKKIINDYKVFVYELNKCSLLLHEKWKEAIEEAAKVLVSKKYNNLVNQLNKVHKQMNESPDNLYEINFNQCFYNELKEAENYLKLYIKNPNDRYIKEAWIIYQTVYNNIQSKYKNMSTIYLEYISPLLSNIPENQIGLPGYFFLDKLYKERKQLIIGKTLDNSFQNEDKPVFIKKLDKYLYVLNTKQRPRKISLIGTDNKEYKYLLKSHEDLRQDERIIQVFNFVNSLLSVDKETSKKNLSITIYPVIPLSHITGLIGFLPNCDTISHLILEERKLNNFIPNIEIQSVYQLCPKYDSSVLLNKVEIFKEANRITSGYELNDIIWTKSVNCESWLKRKSNYARSLSVMSIVGYILGLGDRHPNNLMMNRQNGKIIHIDYGDCFEIAMKRNKFPEKVPFRLTRMLVKALGVSKIEGTFRIISEKVMQLLRENRESLLAILNSLVYDPLVSFRLMIPLIMKMKEKENNIPHHNNIDMFNNSLYEDNLNQNIISSSVMNNDILLKLSKTMTFNFKKNSNVITEINNPIIKEEEKNEKIEENNVEKEKVEKKRIENEERQILNDYEENDEIEFEELNKIAQIILNRITQKLTGMDFNNDNPLEVKEQIDRLINQATSNENLAQSYLGWCPFW